MSKVYLFNDSGACGSREVTMTAGACIEVENYTSPNGEQYIRKQQTFTFTIPTPAATDITINYRIYFVEDDSWSGQNEQWINRAVVLPAGQTSVQRDEWCYIFIYEDFGAGGWGTSTYEIADWELRDQVTIPDVCIDVDPLCDLGISDIDITHPELRGQTGSITVTITGHTGNVIYRINGVTSTTTGGASYTFTNVLSGTYSIYVEDAEGCNAQTTATVLDGDFRTGDFVVSQPAPVMAAHNPIIHNVGTKGAEIVIASQELFANQARTKITVKNEEIVDGARIVFNLTSPFTYHKTFFARTFPNRDNFFLASKVTDINGIEQGVNTREEIAASIGEVLQRDIVISQNYEVFVEDEEVTLIAKQRGSRFNLNSTNVFIRDEDNLDTTDYFTLTVLANGTNIYDGELIDNYSIVGEVFINQNQLLQYPLEGQDQEYLKAAELIIPFQNNNRHMFDVSAIVQNYVHTPKPSYDFEGFTVIPSAIRPYYIRFSESYPIVSNSNTIKRRLKATTDKRWVVNSALSRYNQNDMKDYVGEPISYLNGFFGVNWNHTTTTVTISNPIRPENVGKTYDIEYRLVYSIGGVPFSGWQSGNTFTSVPSGESFKAQVRGTTPVTGLGNIVFMVEQGFSTPPFSTIAARPTTATTIPTIGGRFLTNSPDVKHIQRNQNEYLYFLIRRNFGYPFALRGDIYFYDGSEELGVKFFDITTTGLNSGGVFLMNLSYDKLGLEDYEFSGSTVRKIKYIDVGVYFEYNSEWLPVTQQKRYSFAINEQPRKFGVVFENTLGGYDSFDFIGIVEEEIDREYGEYTVNPMPNQQGALLQGFKQKSIYNTRITKKITANTGYLDIKHYEWLQELLSSNNVYDYGNTNQHYLKVVDYQYIKSSLEDLFDMEVTFEYTVYENNVKE